MRQHGSACPWGGHRAHYPTSNGWIISHRTVERHVSDMFTKLDESSRAAATAYAYAHALV